MIPFKLLKLSSNMTSLMLETQTVMALRLMGMSGLTPHSPDENMRMVTEKGPAMVKSYTEATKAALAGKRPDQVIDAAMKPLSSEVRANRKRLMK